MSPNKTEYYDIWIKGFCSPDAYECLDLVIGGVL